VPAIVRWPGVSPERQVSSGMASAMDLFVTLATAGGASLPRDQPLDGHDLRAFLAGRTPSPNHEFFYVNGPRVEGVRVDEWKLRALPDAAPELYHLELDPSERYNRAADQPAVLTRLRQRLLAFAATLPSP
jgi:arylsulfatase A